MYGEVKAFEELRGKEFDFYGADGEHFKLGDTVWRAVEDDDDGYRSYLGSIKAEPDTILVFRPAAFARVRVESYDEHSQDGFRLVDVSDGHVWLRVGTDNTDDYYPYFVFEYKAKTPE